MRIQTHSLRAYCASRSLSLIAGLHELWRIDKGRSPVTDSENIGISCDLETWRKTGDLPRYAANALEHERVRQIQMHARASPSFDVV